MELLRHPQKGDDIKGYIVKGIIKEKRHGILCVWYKLEHPTNKNRRIIGYNPKNKRVDACFATYPGLHNACNYRTW